jgi:predicted small integral membrane protein
MEAGPPAFLSGWGHCFCKCATFVVMNITNAMRSFLCLHCEAFISCNDVGMTEDERWLAFMQKRQDFNTKQAVVLAWGLVLEQARVCRTARVIDLISAQRNSKCFYGVQPTCLCICVVVKAFPALDITTKDGIFVCLLRREYNAVFAEFSVKFPDIWQV